MNKIFSFAGNMIMAVIVAIIVSLYYNLETDLTIITALIALFVIAKINMAFYFTQGHGVGVNRSSKNFLRMPIILIVFFVIALGLSTALFATALLSNNELSTITTNNIAAIGLTMLLTTVLAILRWYLSAYQEAFHGSEYIARMELKIKYDKLHPIFWFFNNRSKLIEGKIQKLRELGVLPKKP